MQPPQSSRLLIPRSFPFIQKQAKPQDSASLLIQQYEQCKAIYLPTYLFGFMTELVKVDLVQQKIKCRFKLYVLIIASINTEIVRKLKAQQFASFNEQQLSIQSRKEYEKIFKFLSNNLIIECGQQIIDIVHNPPIEVDSQQDSDEQSQEEQQPQMQFFYKKMQNNSSDSLIAYQVQGMYQCSFELKNFFFPYHHINSTLKLRVRQQYFDNIIYRYNLQSFDQNSDIMIKQFSLKFQQSSHRKFGIYRVNCLQSTYNATPNFYSQQTFQSQNIQEDNLLDDLVPSYPMNLQNRKYIRFFIFKFQIYCCSIPFTSRNLVPLIILNFASLMMYLAETDSVQPIYNNICLIAITLIQLLTNFRKSKYDASTFNLYQAYLVGLIMVNFLLMIISTRNFYNYEENIGNDENQFSATFWVSIGISSFFLFINIFMLIFYSYKINQSFRQDLTKDLSKETSYLRIQDEEDLQQIRNLIGLDSYIGEIHSKQFLLQL